MDASLYLAAALAGAAYTLTPGPAFLALLGIGAGQGRRAGFSFLAGHFAGVITWGARALVAIIGSASLGTFVFALLGVICGCYRMLLGWRAVTARRTADGKLTAGIARPLRRGIAFGLTNPKSYAVAIAMFTALLAAHTAQLSWMSLPTLLLAAFARLLLGCAILLFLIGPYPVHMPHRHIV